MNSGKDEEGGVTPLHGMQGQGADQAPDALMYCVRQLRGGKAEEPEVGRGEGRGDGGREARLEDSEDVLCYRAGTEDVGLACQSPHLIILILGSLACKGVAGARVGAS